MSNIKIYDSASIDAIGRAGALAAQVLDRLEPLLQPGMTTAQIDEHCAEWIAQAGALAAPLNYRGFPRSVCTSRNDVICHGIPDEGEPLQPGDIINVDVTVILDGFHGDTSRTFLIGEVPKPVQIFVERTYKAMMRGIGAAQAGKRFNVIGEAIERYTRKFGYSVVRDYCGHGIGTEFHEEPAVLHYQHRRPLPRLEDGMVFTVEPMINMSGNWRSHTDETDGWTARTLDGALSAQFEHTVAIVDGRARILTPAAGEVQ